MVEVNRVISYKKVKMTEDEFDEYKKICFSYDRPNFKGEELFKDTFEVNDDGRLIYIKALGERQASFEVLFFLMNLMQNQWLRASIGTMNEEINKIVEKEKELDKLIIKVEKKLAQLNK
jgi:hypothetical protein